MTGGGVQATFLVQLSRIKALNRFFLQQLSHGCTVMAFCLGIEALLVIKCTTTVGTDGWWLPDFAGVRH